MRLINSTIFPAMTFDHWARNGQEQTVVILKATLRRQDDGWSWDCSQADILFEDMFDGDPAHAPLLAEQELAPEKPATDLIIHATAHAPGGKPLAEWPVRVQIPGRLEYGFHVRGAVQWRKSPWRGWHLSEPQPVAKVAIDYRLAFGGAAADEVYQMNPAGRGFDPSQRNVPPQIGSLADFRRKDPYQPIEVHGLGPIAKTWLPRRSLAGTYDAAWCANRQPGLPDDFDPRFWNAAPRPLQLSPHLTGGEELHLENLHPSKPLYQLRLPDVAPRGWLASQDAVGFRLDTVVVDIRQAEPKHLLTLIWRAGFPASDMHQSFRIEMMQL